MCLCKHMSDGTFTEKKTTKPQKANSQAQPNRGTHVIEQSTSHPSFDRRNTAICLIEQALSNKSQLLWRAKFIAFPLTFLVIIIAKFSRIL